MAPDTPPKSTQPRIADLMSRYLSQQAQARAAGISETPLNEVEPYEAAAFPLVEPRSAWEEATAALRLLDTEKACLSVTAPADWSTLVAGLDSIAAVTFASGNFPQLVRDLPALIRSRQRSELQPKRSANQEVSSNATGTKGQVPDKLLAIGMHRLAGRFQAAERLIAEVRAKAGGRWQAALENEEAALAWHRGDVDAAAALWAKMPDSAPVCFNRGMAFLFLDKPADARVALTQAVGMLPEENAWHHLARLYLALAGI